MDGVHDAKRLAELKALPLERKILITQTRIIEWYTHFNGKVCVSFSGGKDSTVLLHIAREIYPNIPVVFVNTGLEFPEIVRFAHQPGVDVVRPKMRFDEVISKYGYPLISKETAEAIYYARRIKHGDATNKLHNGNLIETSAAANRRTALMGDMPKETSKTDWTDWRRQSFSNPVEQFGAKSQFNKERWLPLARDIPVGISHICCNRIKKAPLHLYQKENGYVPILATLAEESRARWQTWIRTGCNAFDGKDPKSQPMSFWTENDILQYIVKNDLDIASVYGNVVASDDEGNEYDPNSMLGDCKLKCTGCQRTGCTFCAFGFHLDRGETRFQRLAMTHPKLYEYALKGGQWVDNPKYDPAAPEYDGEWKNWNPKKIWVPSKEGLGMRKVFDMVNEIYGKDFYRYE